MIYRETWAIIDDALRAIVATEMNGGRLAAFQTFSEVVPPEGEPTPLAFPVLGIEYDGTDENVASTRSSLQTSTFTIAAYVFTAFDATNPTPDIVKRTKAALKLLWNDGNGNGLGAVIRSDPTFGGIAISALPSKLRMVAGRRDTESAGADGILLCTLTVLAELQTQ